MIIYCNCTKYKSMKALTVKAQKFEFFLGLVPEVHITQ